MFGRDIQRMMEDMERAMAQSMEMTRGSGLGSTPEGVNGRRVEITNGSVTEEYLVDGEWVDKREYLEGQDDGGSSVFDFIDGTFTIDLSSRVEGDKAVADASINNGVLTVEFETRTEDPESDE